MYLNNMQLGKAFSRETVVCYSSPIAAGQTAGKMLVIYVGGLMKITESYFEAIEGGGRRQQY